MRLIDADEVKKAFVGNRYGTKAIEYVIDNAPTVEAIPIEWIKQFEEKTSDITNMKDFDIMFAGHLKYLIDEWEKENDRNQT